MPRPVAAAPLFAALVFVWTLPAPMPARAEERAASQNWPRFRGPHGVGVMEGKPLPAKWDATTGEGIRWKAEIPGLAHSSPIVWGERVYLTTAISDKPDPYFRPGRYGDVRSVEQDGAWTWKVLCLEKATGELLWEQTAHHGTPRIKRHMKSTHADNTPATDGRHVVAIFGSEGLWCYTVDGELKWQQDLGKLEAAFSVMPDAQWEFGSSPIIYDGMVIVQADALNTQFLRAYDLETGAQRWNVQRDELPTWTTPTVVECPGRVDLVCNGSNAIVGYDPRDGSERWRLLGNSTIVIPTPFEADGLIYVCSGYRPIQPIYAIRCDATGEITLADGEQRNEWVAWSQDRRGPYMPTPVAYNGLLFVSDNGIATAYDARTGERRKNVRLPRTSGAFVSSLVAGDGKVYIPGEDGDVFVLRADASCELLSANPMGETLLATPAISDGVIYMRGRRTLWAVGG